MNKYFVYPSKSVKKRKESFAIYHTLKIFITLGKILGYLHLYVDEYGSLPNRKQNIVNRLHKTIAVGAPLILCHLGWIMFAVHDSEVAHSVRELDKVISLAIFGANLIAVDITFGNCMVCSYRFIAFIRHLAVLDDLIGDKLPKKKFKWAQILVLFCILVLILLRTYRVIATDIKIDAHWVFTYVHIIFLYYFIFLSYWFIYDTFLLAFLLWIFATAYAEIQKTFKRSLEVKSLSLGVAILYVRNQERKVYRIVCEARRVFALHVTVVTLQTSFLVCLFFYYFVNYENYFMLLFAVGFFSPLACLAIAADYLKNQHKNLITSLSDLDSSSSCISEQDHVEVDLFRWKLMNCSVDISGHGFFSLSRELVTTILGSIATYIVILSQFRSNAEEDISTSCQRNSSLSN